MASPKMTALENQMIAAHRKGHGRKPAPSGDAESAWVAANEQRDLRIAAEHDRDFLLRIVEEVHEMAHNFMRSEGADPVSLIAEIETITGATHEEPDNG